MDEGEGKQWRKRISWAQCCEPFKTELDTLASHWIEGALSREDLSLELWKQFAKCNVRDKQNEGKPIFDLVDVAVDLRILVNAMLAEDYSRTETNSESRRTWLETCCAEVRTVGFKREP